MSTHKTTPNGFDTRWIEAINTALEQRGDQLRLGDINSEVWASFIEPMIAHIEAGTYPDLISRNYDFFATKEGQLLAEGHDGSADEVANKLFELVGDNEEAKQGIANAVASESPSQIALDDGTRLAIFPAAV
jgi:hypothetical protein